MIYLRDADTGAELIPLSNASYLPHRPDSMIRVLSQANSRSP